MLDIEELVVAMVQVIRDNGINYPSEFMRFGMV
jgi:hypothetical protein